MKHWQGNTNSGPLFLGNIKRLRAPVMPVVRAFEASMKYLIILALILSPISVLAENPAESLNSSLKKTPENDFNKKYEVMCDAIAKYKFLKSKCGKQKDYINLFEITPLITGADTEEYISEVSGSALIKCPEQYLSALNIQNNTLIKSVVDSLGVAPPPWELAEAVYPFLNKPKIKPMMDKYFRSWVLRCTLPNGKARVGTYEKP